MKKNPWLDGFLKYLKSCDYPVPLDFFSWHTYTSDPYNIRKGAEYARDLLDSYGYSQTEIILDEYNYLLNWTDRFTESVLDIIGIRGAAFTSACMVVGQDSPLEMLMYYDARPCGFNGLFDFYTLRPLKGYYPFVCFSKLAALENWTYSESSDSDIFVTAASDGNAKAFVVTYYHSGDDASEKRELRIRTGVPGKWRIAVTDKDKKNEITEKTTIDGVLELTLEPNAFFVAESV